jgi:hypothetical protein
MRGTWDVLYKHGFSAKRTARDTQTEPTQVPIVSQIQGRDWHVMPALSALPGFNSSQKQG